VVGSHPRRAGSSLLYSTCDLLPPPANKQPWPDPSLEDFVIISFVGGVSLTASTPAIGASPDVFPCLPPRIAPGTPFCISGPRETCALPNRDESHSLPEDFSAVPASFVPLSRLLIPAVWTHRSGARRAAVCRGDLVPGACSPRHSSRPPSARNSTMAFCCFSFLFLSGFDSPPVTFTTLAVPGTTLRVLPKKANSPVPPFSWRLSGTELPAPARVLKHVPVDKIVFLFSSHCT